jgi:hypothetical protein
MDINMVVVEYCMGWRCSKRWRINTPVVIMDALKGLELRLLEVVGVNRFKPLSLQNLIVGFGCLNPQKQ